VYGTSSVNRNAFAKADVELQNKTKHKKAHHKQQQFPVTANFLHTRSKQKLLLFATRVTTIATRHLLGPWFSLGSSQIYAVFPYTCINNLALARCMVRFPKEAAFASADYGHSYTYLLGFFLWFLPFVVRKNLHGKIKSCNINPGVPQIAPTINVAA
jgi:hypothetical protein